MGKNVEKVVSLKDSSEFRAAVASLKAGGAKSDEKKEIVGECSRLAMEVQANTAALYIAHRAHDKAHNPRADILAGEIRSGLREAGIGKQAVNLACKDALAILRCESFEGRKSGADFLAAFEELGLKTANAVRKHAMGVKSDPVAELAAKVARLSDADRARFESLLASSAQAAA